MYSSSVYRHMLCIDSDTFIIGIAVLLSVLALIQTKKFLNEIESILIIGTVWKN